MLSYNNHQIAAINVMLNAEVKEMKLVIFKDGVIDYYEDVPAETVAAIETNKWTKLSLATPYTIEPYTAVRFGYFIIHEKNLYPAKGDNGPAMLNACYIATSSPNSTNFANPKPTWSNVEKSLAGNWMISADITALGETPVPVVKSYNILRNGVKVACDVTALTYTEEAEPGTFSYQVVANYEDGLSSNESASTSATISLPAEYMRPMFTETNFEEGNLSLKWDVLNELPLTLSHHGEPTYSWELSDGDGDVEVYMG